MYFILLLLFTLGICLFIRKTKISYLGMFILVILMGIPDFFYVPNMDDDLYSYYKEMAMVCNYNRFSSVMYAYKYIPTLMHQQSSIIYNYIQWSISKTDIFSLLPVVVVCVVYFCVSVPAIHERIKFNTSLISTLFIIISSILLFQYFNISSTTRWGMASGLFFLITYLYCNVKGYHKFLILPMYIIVYLIHEGTILPIGIIILCTIIKRIRFRYMILSVLMIISIMILLSIYHFNGVLGIASSYILMPSLSNSLSHFIYLSVPIIVSFSYSIGNFFILQKNKDCTYLNTERKLFWMFNLIILCFLPQFVMLNRYVLDVGIINIIIYLDAEKYDCIIPLDTKFIYVIASFLSLISFCLFTWLYMNFNFNQIYMF